MSGTGMTDYYYNGNRGTFYSGEKGTFYFGKWWAVDILTIPRGCTSGILYGFAGLEHFLRSGSQEASGHFVSGDMIQCPGDIKGRP